MGASAWDERGSPFTAPACWPRDIPGELILPLDDSLMQGLESGALPSLSISRQCPMCVEEAYRSAVQEEPHLLGAAGIGLKVNSPVVKVFVLLQTGSELLV